VRQWDHGDRAEQGDAVWKVENRQELEALLLKFDPKNPYVFQVRRGHRRL
jgi:hypothetical protein